jgi:RNA polymerase sigma-70 factor (ECF subfamily)
MDGSALPASAARERDRDILVLLAEGRQEPAFALVLERYERKVFRLCVAMLRDPDQAADAAQDSLVRIWQALGRFDERAALSTWIYTVTRNRCLSAIERRRDHDSLSDEAVAQEVEVRTASGAQVETDDRGELLREFVTALPERYRRPLLLYYYEGCSVDEVAGMLGVAESTVKTWLHRARAMLQDRLAAAGLGDPSLWLEEAA